MRDELYSLGQAHGEFLRLCHDFRDEAWEDEYEKSDLEDALLRCVESFLGYYARLSLFAFPVANSRDKPKVRIHRKARGKAIRAALKIDATHPLGRRTSRNRWAHADEWLDDTLLTAPRRRIVLQFVGDISELRDVDVRRVLRLVDPFHGEAYLLGEQLLIRELVDEADSIFELLETAIQDLQETLGEGSVIWGPTLDEPSEEAE